MSGRQKCQAFTLIELLVVMAVIGILAGIAVLSTRGLQRPALSDMRALAAAVKSARSQAISSTSAVKVRFTPSTRLLSMQRAELCSATTWTDLPASNNVQLEPSVQVMLPLPPDPWEVCFTSRGLATTTPNLKLKDRNRTQIYTLAIYLGGAVKVTP